LFRRRQTAAPGHFESGTSKFEREKAGWSNPVGLFCAFASRRIYRSVNVISITINTGTG
jgi:hypothetical protein